MIRTNEKFALRFDELFKSVNDSGKVQELRIKELEDSHANAQEC
jgi:hypothetical protein